MTAQAERVEQGAAEDGTGGIDRSGLLARAWAPAVAVLLGLVVLALVGGTAWVQSSDPLEPGPAFGPRPPATSVTDNRFGTALVAGGPAGTPNTVVYSLRNRERFPVRLTAAEEKFGIPGMTIRFGPLMTADREIGGGRPEDAVRSIHLAPGEGATVFVTVPRPPCQTGGTSYITSLPFQWSAFGVTKSYDLQLHPEGMPRLVLCSS